MPRFEDLSPKAVAALNIAGCIVVVSACLTGAHLLLGFLAKLAGIQ